MRKYHLGGLGCYEFYQLAVNFVKTAFKIDCKDDTALFWLKNPASF